MSLIYAVHQMHQTAVTHQTSQRTASVSSARRQSTEECGGAAAKNKQQIVN